MSLAALTGLLNGFADGTNDRKDREAHAKDQVLREREIDAMERYQPYEGGNQSRHPASNGVFAGRGGSGYGRASQGPRGRGDGTLQGLIDNVEGGGNYDTLFGHSQGDGGRYSNVRVSQMTLGQLYDFSSPSGDYGQWVKGKVGRVATPMGRNQIVGTTLRATAKEMGLSPNTVYSKDVQDQMFAHLANKRLRGQKTADGRRSAMRSEWDGFKHVSDNDLDAAIARFQSGSAPKPAPEHKAEAPATTPRAASLGPRIAAMTNEEAPSKWDWLAQKMNGEKA